MQSRKQRGLGSAPNIHARAARELFRAATAEFKRAQTFSDRGNCARALACWEAAWTWLGAGDAHNEGSQKGESLELGRLLQLADKVRTRLVSHCVRRSAKE